MAQPTVQTSFASGEWAPKLRSRVDIQKYRSGAALLRNFFVDYSGGGASTRQGTKFINQCKLAGSRLIPFQPSSTLSYVLEFGNLYLRFYSNGAPILEAAVTGGTNASGNTFTIANSYSVGDWVFAQNWGGLTNVNGNYFIVAAGTSGSAVVVTDLNGNAVTFSGAYTSGGQLSRVYTLPTPYLASDLFPNPLTGNPGLKWVQDVTSLIICHPSYPPQILTINSAASWQISTINFGPTIATPTNLAITTTDTPGTNWYYGYLITAVDVNGQESAPTAPVVAACTDPISTIQMANNLTWTAVSGAMSYNVYKASPSFTVTTPAGAQFGFVSNVTSNTFRDSTPGIAPDFSQTPPVSENPFVGAGVQSYTVTANGAYTGTAPTATVAAPSSGVTATATAQVSAVGTPTVANAGGSGYSVGELVSSNPADTNGQLLFFIVASTSGSSLATVQPMTYPGSYGGSILSGATIPSNPIRLAPTFSGQSVATLNLTWGLTAVLPIQAGDGYTSVPGVTISGGGGGTAVAVLATASAGNPGVPGFLQERLTLAAQKQSVQSFNMSQPGSFFNYNTSNPTQDDDAIQASIISEELNDIRSLTSVATGLAALTGKGAWLINGGGGISTSNPITPTNVTASPQAFNGANDLRPLRVGLDLLYGTNKGNYIRDLTFNIYANIYTGSDISVLSNHLFFGYYMLDWAWAEEPFKTAWAVRNDGMLLSLGFVKEQELIGWAHSDTNGQFTSVCSVIENVNGNIVDAVYVVVQRLINGNLVSYVERMADRYFVYGYEDSWSVDCALQTQPAASPTGALVFTGDASATGNVVTLTDTADAPFTATMATNSWVVRAGGGIYTITAFTSTSQVTATVTQVPSQINPYTNVPFPVSTGYTIWQPVTTVSGLTQLIGQTVTGVADGAVVPATVVSATGSVTLSTSASKITLGLAYTPDLQTLPLDLGEPTVQGKRKKIVGATLRVADTLGLSIGTSIANLVPMKDFILGNIGSQSNQKVTGLVNGDGRTIMDQAWQEAGNYFIRQTQPYPATILGTFPEVTMEDTK